MNIVMKEPVAVLEADLKELIAGLERASDVTEQLETLFKTLEEKAKGHKDILHLVTIGRSYAESWNHAFDSDHSEYQERYFPKP